MEFKTGVIKPVECFQEGWELIKDQYWLFLGITLVGVLIAQFIPLGIGLGAMFCGIYYCLLLKMDSQPVKFEDLFKGFNYFLPGLIVALIVIIPAVIFGVLTYISMLTILFSSIDAHGKINESGIWTLYGTLLTEGVIGGLLGGCLHAFIIFAFPLIVERNLSGVEAFKLSAKAAWKNLSGLIGLIVVQIVLSFIGLLLCYFGALFLMPISFAAFAVAYRKVFPREMRNNYNPPPSPPNFGENFGGWQG